MYSNIHVHTCIQHVYRCKIYRTLVYIHVHVKIYAFGLYIEHHLTRVQSAKVWSSPCAAEYRKLEICVCTSLWSKITQTHVQCTFCTCIHVYMCDNYCTSFSFSQASSLSFHLGSSNLASRPGGRTSLALSSNSSDLCVRRDKVRGGRKGAREREREGGREGR